MRSRPLGGYLALGACIAVVSVVANVANGIEIVSKFDIDTASTLNVVGAMFGQASIALAMVCAVIMGCRTAEAGLRRAPQGTDDTLSPTDEPT